METAVRAPYAWPRSVAAGWKGPSLLSNRGIPSPATPRQQGEALAASFNAQFRVALRETTSAGRAHIADLVA